MDLTGEEKAKATHHRWFGAAGDKDVMCCIKTYMRDTQLQQPPLCVLPADRLGSIQTFSPDRRVGSSMTAGEMERFKYFANVIDDRRYGYHRAAAAAGRLAFDIWLIYCSFSFVGISAPKGFVSVIQRCHTASMAAKIFCT